MSPTQAPQTLAEAKDLLSQLRAYDDMKKKLGKRGVALFKRILNSKHFYKVEYHSSLGKEEALTQALALYKKVFSQTVSEQDIILRENNILGGGMKIYFDDSLLDMSFQRVEKKFQK